VESRPGKRGGYALAKDPGDLTLGQVVRHFDGVLAPISCVSLHAYEPCSQEAVCRFRRVMLNIRNMTSGIMDRLTLAEVHTGRPVANHEVFADLVSGGLGI
jgi:Rrf2 family protein